MIHRQSVSLILHRYINPPKPKHSSIPVVRKLKCLCYSFSYGLEPAGHPCTILLIAFLSFARQVNISLLSLLDFKCWQHVFNQGINHFVQLADDSEEVPNPQKKSYSDFKLTWDDWDRLALMHEVLHVSNVTYFSYVMFLRCTHRNRPKPTRLSWAQTTQLSGGQFQFLSTCRRHGVQWSSPRNLQKLCQLLKLVLITSKNGTARLTKQMLTSSVSVHTYLSHKKCNSHPRGVASSIGSEHQLGLCWG